MRLYELQEGFTIHPGHGPDDKDVIGYTPEGPDDPFFSDLTKSSGAATRTISTLKDVTASTAEIEELSQAIEKNRRGYQDSITVYTAMPVYKETTHTTGKLRSFMDTLKGKPNPTTEFSASGRDALLTDGAKTIVKNFLAKRPLTRIKKIILAPIPSSSQLVVQFAHKLAEQLQNAPGGSGKVSVETDMFQKATVARHGAIRRATIKNADDFDEDKRGYSFPFPSRKLSYEPDALKNLIRDYVHAWTEGRVSDEQIHKDFYNLKVKVIKKIKDLKTRLNNTEDAKQQEELTSEIDVYQQKLEFLETEYETAVERRQELVTSPGYQPAYRNPREIKANYGLTRGLTFDRFEIKQTSPLPPGTLLVLVDDNIDTSKSIIDLYRTLFKKGVVNQRNNVSVTVFALQQMK